MGPFAGALPPSALFLLLILFSSTALAQYEVRQAAGAKHLSITLTLPAGVASPIRLAPRGAAWGLKPQVSNVQCGDLAVPQDQEGYWVAPAGCPRLSWRVVPDAIPIDGADASEQRTLAVGPTRWILLSEPTSLLRPVNANGATTIQSAPGHLPIMGASQIEPGIFRVPPVNSGPEFFVVGRAETSRRTLGEIQVTYVADDARQVKQRKLQALHASALRYLTQVVPLPRVSSAMDRSLLVVWLGVSESRGGAGGAAGSRSFLANYVLGSSENEGRNTALTMMIVAHEQFHQLVDVLRADLPDPPLAVWVNESIAQYYGLKALRVADPSRSAQEVWAKFIDQDRPVEQGLVELNRRYESGDASVYELFYSQGATFWYAIDSALKAATQGRKGLDDHLVELLRGPRVPGSDLPPSFVEAIRKVAGPGIDPILSRYVDRSR